MAGYDSDLEDFEIEGETILYREINLKFNEYSSEEIIQQKSSMSMNWITLINI